MPDIFEIVENVIVEEIVEQVVVEEIVENVTITEGGTYNLDVTYQAVNAPIYRFSWGDATPYKIFTLQKNRTLLSVIANITESFNGSNASIMLGTLTTPDLFFSTDNLNVDVTENYVCFENDVDTDIYLTLNSGVDCSQGKGSIILSISNKNNVEIL